MRAWWEFRSLRVGWFALVVCCAGHAATPNDPVPPAFDWQLPRGFPAPAVPADNPMSAVKVALGQRLFFDTQLSVTGHYSCASCHQPERAFSDGRAEAIGATGHALADNAMALVNVAYNLRFGWLASQTDSLEAQMLKPMLSADPIELGLRNREPALLSALAKDRCYRDAFDAAFPRERSAISFGNLIKAIAAYERTLISGDSPFDRYVFGGDDRAISEEAKRGMALFYSRRLGCAGCHAGFNFSGNWRDRQGSTGPASYANNGTAEDPIRVPTLRNVALTAPYMHDGRYATLEAVLEHYERIGGQPDSALPRNRDPRLRFFKLMPEERGAVIAFLQALTDTKFASVPPRYTCVSALSDAKP